MTKKHEATCPFPPLADLVLSPVCRLPSSLERVEGEVLFLQSKITEVLGGSGYNTERLATPYVPQYTGKNPKTISSLRQ